MPYRIASPPPPDPPEEEDPYAALLRARARRARVVGVGGSLAILALLAGFVARPSTTNAEQRRGPTTVERLRTAQVAIADARTAAHEAQAAFEHELRRAIDERAQRATSAIDERAQRARSANGAKLDGLPSAGACPIGLPAAAIVNRVNRRHVPMLVVAEDDPALPSQMVAEVLADVERAERHVARGSFEEAALYARALALPDRYRAEVVVVASTLKKPHAWSPTAYEPGAVEGHAYLYDFGTRRVVCAGPIHAASSKEIGFQYSPAPDAPISLAQSGSLAYAIDVDMELQIARASRDALRYRVP